MDLVDSGRGGSGVGCGRSPRIAAIGCLWLAVWLFAPHSNAEPDPSRMASAFGMRLAEAALERTKAEVRYDGRYLRIPYPGGDVPAHLGVCTDVVIRAYRSLGIDLQRDVHEEMLENFSAFPNLWGLEAPDPNIDHRRVPNLRVLFMRRGESLAVSDHPDIYAAGDLVTWTVGGHRPHIGIVSDRRSGDGERPLIVHNIGEGPRLEDMLFDYPITGHYRYAGRQESASR